MTGDYRVLHVDDEPDFPAVAADYLERENSRFQVETATSAAEGLDILDQTEIDCIVSDYDMPGANGIDFLQSVRSEFPDLPFILFTGKGTEEVASRAISAGVTDYLQKEGGSDQFTVLANRIENVIDKYRAERELDVTRRQYQKVTEQNLAGIYLIQDGKFVYVNPTSADIHGYDRETMIGMSPLELVAPEERGRVRENLRRRLDGEVADVQYETVGLTKDGDRIDIEVHGSQITYEGKPAVIGTELDITERKERQRELERERDRRTALFENAPHPIIEVAYPDEAPIIEDVNGAFEETFGFEAEDVVGQSVAEAVVPESERDEFEKLKSDVYEGKTVFTEVERNTAYGTRTFLTAVIPVDVDQVSSGGYAWYTDVTEAGQ